MVHCAFTLHTVPVGIWALFENKAPPLLQTSSPGVLYCGGAKARITLSMSLVSDDGQSGKCEIVKKIFKHAVKLKNFQSRQTYFSLVKTI